MYLEKPNKSYIALYRSQSQSALQAPFLAFLHHLLYIPLGSNFQAAAINILFQKLGQAHLSLPLRSSENSESAARELPFDIDK